MPGLRITSQAAREGCLRYIHALGVLNTEQQRALRQQLLITSARRVADVFWTQFWATQPAASPDPLQEELGYTLERLAVEPAFFRNLTV